jgi:hypothetical protein
VQGNELVCDVVLGAEFRVGGSESFACVNDIAIHVTSPSTVKVGVAGGLTFVKSHS